MRTIKLKKLELENFKCFEHKVVEFSDRSTVRGRNGIGKSSLYDALMWVLFDKNAAGESASGIRPHDADGNEIHFTDISAAATFDVDGREITLKKTQKEKYVKDRATKEQMFKGNVNEFSVNDIPKSQKDYKQYISENFCDEEIFLSCTSASSFFKLDTKKRRQKLLSLAGNLSDADVIATDTEFERLAYMLKDGTVDELMTRSKSTIKRLNDTLKALPARIDEQQKSKVDIDTAELELARNAMKEKIAEIEAKESDLSKQYEEYQETSDGILEIQFQMNDMKRKAHEELTGQKRKLQLGISDQKNILSGIESDIRRNEQNIARYENEIANGTKEKNRLAEQWKAVKEEAFDESQVICPTCHRELPQDKVGRLRTDFEKTRAERLADIVKKGNDAKADVENAKTALEHATETNKQALLHKEETQSKIADLEKKLADLPDEADVSGNTEYQQLEKQLTEKEEFSKQGISTIQVRGTLASDKREMLAELDRINSELARAARNDDIDDRIEELRSEQRLTAQRVADEERTLDLLERYNRAKMNLLTERINGNFQKVQWKLFQEQINGGYSDVCFATVNGTNRERGLNDSDCLLADLDILQTFQKMNDVSLPLFLDRGESINSDRIPKTECQLIVLAVSDDEEMVVESHNTEYLSMLNRSRKQLEGGNVVVKTAEELERMEDEYDASIADEAYANYLESGKKK